MANLFNTVSNLEKEIKTNSDNYGKDTINTVELLVSFISSCPLHTTSINKFICANFRLPFNTMYNLYSNTNSLSKDSFKVAYHNCLREFTNVFANYDLDLVFRNEDTTKLQEIYTLIYLIQNDNKYRMKLADILAIKIPTTKLQKKTQNKYSLAECSNEIQFIKTYERTTVDTLLNNINEDKLRYIVNLLQKPILCANKGTKEDGTQYYKKDKCINTDKYALLLLLKEIQPISSVDIANNTITQNDIKQTVIELEEKAAQIKDATKDNLNIPSYFEGLTCVNEVIAKRLEKTNEFDYKQYTREDFDKEEYQRDKHIADQLANAFTFFNMDYLEKYLNAIPKGVLQYVLDNYKRR